MGNVSLRGIDDHVKNLLKAEALKNGMSVNRLILSYIHKGIGIDPMSRTRYHDLDKLSGTWSDTERDEFLQATSSFNQIDEEMWK